jgi:PhnB protein
MLADPMSQSSFKSPKQLGGVSGGLYVYVEDVDEVVQQVVDAGGTIGMPVETMFWGDRFGSVTDPFGHIWQIATRVEEVPPEEMAERTKAAMASMS